jgi:hypothetical protein
VKKNCQLLDKKNIKFELIRFKGKHEIHTETLKGIANRLK